MTDSYSDEYYKLANTIALQAEAIAEGRVIGTIYGAVSRLVDNTLMLRAWTKDDRT